MHRARHPNCPCKPQAQPHTRLPGISPWTAAWPKKSLASPGIVCKLMMAEFIGCLQGLDESIYEDQRLQSGVVLPQGVSRQCLETFLIVQLSVCVCTQVLLASSGMLLNILQCPGPPRDKELSASKP